MTEYSERALIQPMHSPSRTLRALSILPASEMFRRSAILILGTLGFIALANAQSNLQFTSVQWLTNQEILLKLSAPTGANYRVEVSTNLLDWNSWMTLAGAGVNQSTDSAAP